MGIEVKNNINAPKKIAEVSNEKLWLFAAHEWHRLIFPFTPFRTGAMAADVYIHADSSDGYITYDAPYARKQYEGAFDWRKDLHPLATGKWDKAAEPTQRKKLADAMSAFVKRGGTK